MTNCFDVFDSLNLFFYASKRTYERLASYCAVAWGSTTMRYTNRRVLTYLLTFILESLQ